ncbi:DUF808 domain-containing protein [Corynebacterium sp. ES2794-CONJ1]|uniref:DUF808 domain-containing protein n=1 Tax=unclassified Corynebacterium TaxID=2624378 RepID=UPI002167CB06|nr:MULTISPECIES: DUF808 domain-containing protein [unclassified Corynebacterium]MCS4489907.1 DUF808 domain-containing protein [Corynebacterium sp. ES2775-CONJ]MCS4491730.1 DUF808 domain-containing protein [Corynebacterium sp. ES2715-CONJ3]MCS4531835.1 DUF808 domain-containing protein [Corynebacterium sp. ES2730-CONJ]MCU9519231.1 DUF808 domain-containing protein [Corynebacterium sp. ES2794-CONJ1]
MAGGLAALLDDIALIAKTAASSVDDIAASAAKTSAKAAGLVIDDTAVTPRFVEGVSPARELPIIWRITKGSLFNKLIVILPIALILNTLAPWLLVPILMLGGFYLCFEGAEKFLEMISGHEHHQEKAALKDEKALVRGAITTDLILSAEIMVISLNEVADQPLWKEAAILVVVALAVTVGVYGSVSLLVKMDDLGLSLMTRDSLFAQRTGRALVAGMPKVLDIISVVGLFAMLWVGGHILLAGFSDLGWSAPIDFVHHLSHQALAWGGFVSWLTDTFFSLVVGLVAGTLIVGIFKASKRVINPPKDSANPRLSGN